MCQKQNTPGYRIPSAIDVAGHRYRMVRMGSADGGRKVSQLYPFTARGGHGGEYLIEQTAAEPQW
jgi:hypothetical protein